MVEVTVRSLRNWQTQIEIAGHTLIADEPAYSGGNDAGPDPYGLLLAALGACTSMTVNLYAREQHWPLAAIEIVLLHNGRHFQDCSGSQSNTSKITEIRRRIRLEGPLNDEQRVRLMEIATHSPIYRTLAGNIKIVDKLLD
jgi:putative redox protein